MTEVNLLLAAHSLVNAHRYGDAFRPVATMLDENPESPELLFLAGSILRGMDCPGMAMPILAKALSKNQSQPNLWMQYGSTLHDLNLWDEAREVFERVGRMLPDDPMPIANIAATYVQQGRWQKANEIADKALKKDDKSHIAHITKGFACLALGRWKEAWDSAEYLYGSQVVVRVYRDKENEEPQWDGTKGKTVVVSCDQGVGDIIMLSQCLNDMVKDCKLVIVECAERLVSFFKRNFPDVVVYGTLKSEYIDWPKEYEIDAHIHMSYLGKFYRNSDSDFKRKPYIKPDPVLVDKWKEWLKNYPRPYIGIAWQGGIQKTQKHVRSIPLSEYAPIIGTGGTFFDLSYHNSAREVAEWNLNNETQIICPLIDDSNYEDTIAFVSCLTEVVTVTTTIAHVCGAIGKSACVLVPEIPTWRYAYKCGDGMIWYPEKSVKLFRVAHGELDWDKAINRVAKHLSSTKLAIY